MKKLTPEDEEYLKAPISQWKQNRTVGLAVLLIFAAIMLFLAACSSPMDVEPVCEFHIVEPTEAALFLRDSVGIENLKGCDHVQVWVWPEGYVLDR